MDVYQRRRLVALSALAAIFIVIVLLIRSCGDEEEAPVTPLAGATGTGGATVLAQREYADQADAICLEANNQLAAVDETDVAQAATDRSEIITGELQQLQTLPPPDDGETKLDSLLGALEELATAYGDQATAAERGDDAAVADLDATIDELNADAAKAAENFGMEVCGDPTQTGDTGDAGDTEADTAEGDTGDESAVEPTAPTDTETVPAPTEITPEATTTPVPTTEPPPTDAGGEAAPAPPTDTGEADSSSGGVSP